MKQVLVISGGNSFAKYEDYMRYLKEKPVDLAYAYRTGWKTNLHQALGHSYQVVVPRMPNRDNAKYAEWVVWLERHLSLLENEVILVGHSLGGCFLAKYLATTNTSKIIRGTFLVAPPFDETRHHSTEFTVETPLDLLAVQGGELHAYFSEDDAVVSYGESEKYRAALPNAHIHSFADRGHFNQEEFPELVADIKSL